MGAVRIAFVERHPTASNKVRVTFSENVVDADAISAANYTLNNGATVSSAAQVTATTVYDLTLGGTPLSKGTLYNLLVANVRDAATNTAILAANGDFNFEWLGMDGVKPAWLNNVVGDLSRNMRAFVNAQPLGRIDTAVVPVSPSIAVVSPSDGSPLASATAAITIDVTVPESSSLLSIQIDAVQSGVVRETVFSGTVFTSAGFASEYAAGSSITSIAGGYRLVIARSGWINNPQLKIEAFDGSGQVTSAFPSWIYPPPPTPTAIQLVRAIDARALDVIFSAAVVESEALVASNYSISPSLVVKSVQKVSDLEYLLTTSKQTELENYTVTVSGIHDRNGYPVT